jgi:hypothetical protein
MSSSITIAQSHIKKLKKTETRTAAFEKSKSIARRIRHADLSNIFTE